jgi:very-short-patch-repair endonuclease
MKLESRGFRIIRFNEEQIIDHPQRVAEEIKRYIKRRLDNNLSLKEK